MSLRRHSRRLFTVTQYRLRKSDSSTSLSNMANANQGGGGPEQDGYFSKGYEWASNHPFQAAGLGTAALVIAAPGVVAAPLLGAAGFGANGIVGGTIAAGVQSSIGNVAAGGLFATLQSAAAGGYGVAAVNGVIQGSAVLGVAVPWLRREKRDQECEEEPGNNEEDDGSKDGGEGDQHAGEPESKL
ncbi:hypothetical protein B0T10DRAFT_181753 [Thelonectria olida]|uniref:Uncharacterized protein n=1 Tax=Thelonectria olida TaxID=1576542 RepID=A0A9P8WFE4_9HYPO|nr:hypothetical protein B0T10DRAFT_181753 [Thelonectria olida]